METYAGRKLAHTTTQFQELALVIFNVEVQETTQLESNIAESQDVVRSVVQDQADMLDVFA